MLCKSVTSLSSNSIGMIFYWSIIVHCSGSPTFIADSDAASLSLHLWTINSVISTTKQEKATKGWCYFLHQYLLHPLHYCQNRLEYNPECMGDMQQTFINPDINKEAVKAITPLWCCLVYIWYVWNTFSLFLVFFVFPLSECAFTTDWKRDCCSKCHEHGFPMAVWNALQIDNHHHHQCCG